jgi:hypothetical protein
MLAQRHAVRGTSLATYVRLSKNNTEFQIYAVTENIGKTVFDEEAGQTLIEDGIIDLFTFDPTQEVIIRWIH